MRAFTHRGGRRAVLAVVTMVVGTVLVTTRSSVVYCLRSLRPYPTPCALASASLLGAVRHEALPCTLILG